MFCLVRFLAREYIRFLTGSVVIWQPLSFSVTSQRAMHHLVQLMKPRRRTRAQKNLTFRTGSRLNVQCAWFQQPGSWNPQQSLSLCLIAFQTSTSLLPKLPTLPNTDMEHGSMKEMNKCRAETPHFAVCAWCAFPQPLHVLAEEISEGESERGAVFEHIHVGGSPLRCQSTIDQSIGPPQIHCAMHMSWEPGGSQRHYVRWNS